MSYILDALRKADAERERDPARGIHAQPAAGAPARAARLPAAWAWPVACAVAAVVAGYVVWGRDEPPAVAVVAPAAPLAIAAAAVPVPAMAQVAPLETVAPVTAVTVATSVSPPPPAPVERMVTKAVLAPRLPGTPVPKAAEPALVATTPTPSAPVAPVALAPPATIATSRPTSPGAVPPAAITVPPASDRILSIAELPADVQRDLPKLSISGGVHSENAAQRMLIVGGQVMTEGQEVATGVVLEQIRARSAVLRFRGLRYSVVY